MRERMERLNIDRLLVYADREHSANMSYLTGFDPRFEEALLIVAKSGEPAILVGNENWGTAGAAALPLRRHLFQDFSLPGQPRDRSRSLADILGGEGVAAGTKVGLVGWKTYARPEITDMPAYLVDELRSLAGAANVTNATNLLIDAQEGLRVISEVEQLAMFEWAACHTSDGVQRLLFGLQPGITEQQAVGMLGWIGWPLSCYVMLTAGPRARFSLSPSDRPIERGDTFTTAFGIWGAFNAQRVEVLPRQEYAEAHLPGSANVPLEGADTRNRGQPGQLPSGDLLLGHPMRRQPACRAAPRVARLQRGRSLRRLSLVTRKRLGETVRARRSGRGFPLRGIDSADLSADLTAGVLIGVDVDVGVACAHVRNKVLKVGDAARANR